MSSPFELGEDGKVRIVGVAIRDNAQPEADVLKLPESWQLTMTRNSRGHFIATGFKLCQ